MEGGAFESERKGTDERLPAKVRTSVAKRKTRRGPGPLGTRVGSIRAGGAQGNHWQPTDSREHHTDPRSLARFSH